MGLADYAPIDLYALPERLGVSVLCISDFADRCPGQVAQLTLRDPAGFSAVIIPMGDGSIAIVNDTHSIGRRNSSLAHKLSHRLLCHTTEEIDNCAGCRKFEREVENEAESLVSHILITNEAAQRIVRSGADVDEALSQYGVSRRMLDWRLNASGARIRHQRAQGRWRRAS